jgi:hypothetical protein
MYQSQQISGAALAAFMPTFTSENGFKGANAQIATLAPYGTAAVSMIALSFASDWSKNRGWYVNFGFVLMIAGFGIYLGVPASNHAARFAALIFAEAGHYSKPIFLRGGFHGLIMQSRLRLSWFGLLPIVETNLVELLLYH